MAENSSLAGPVPVKTDAFGEASVFVAPGGAAYVQRKPARRSATDAQRIAPSPELERGLAPLVLDPDLAGAGLHRVTRAAIRVRRGS